LGVCILIAPEIVIGAVIVAGAVVVAVAIKEELDSYRRASRERSRPEAQTRPIKDSSAKQKPKPEPSGQDWFPPVPTEPLERDRRPECRPVPVPRASKDDPHNECADKFPPNRYPGMDVSVGGIRFDALRDIAMACGYDFVIGVSTQAHKEALLEADFSLNVVVTGCKR
jgi:hypothetical protein